MIFFARLPLFAAHSLCRHRCLTGFTQPEFIDYRQFGIDSQPEEYADDEYHGSDEKRVDPGAGVLHDGLLRQKAVGSWNHAENISTARFAARCSNLLCNFLSNEHA